MSFDEKSSYILLNTVYVGDNFGSSLQAFALKHFIEDNFSTQCVVVERREKGVYARVLRIKYKVFNFFKSFLSPKLFITTWQSQINKFNKGVKNDSYSDKILDRFAIFTDKHINPVYLTNKELKEYSRNSNCMACVTGSDQVWNPTPIALKAANFLLFSPKEKNISYAASIGADEVPYYNYLSFKKKIKNISHVSVREQTAKELLNNEFAIEAQVCVDPVVLVGKDFWLTNMEATGVNQPYTFCYFLNKPSKQAVDFIKKKIADKENVLVISRKDFSTLGVHIINDVSPLQFVSYIHKADDVLTDSFHGMMFSILLNKTFFVFERDYENHIPQSSRIVTLLERLGISERYISGDKVSVEKSNIDYRRINDIIEKKQEESKRFLKEAMRSE